MTKLMLALVPAVMVVLALGMFSDVRLPDARDAGASAVSPTEAHIAQAATPPRIPWLGRLLRIATYLTIAIILVAFVLLFFEDKFVYFATSTPAIDWAGPGLGVEQCSFRTADGLTLHGWWHDGGAPEAARRPVLLWCHGNAGNITHRAENLQMLVGQGFAVLLFDYRGYGRSEGSPSERGLYLDAEAAYQHLVRDRGVAPDRIICFGRSLGAAVALSLAVRYRVAGVIMESSFASVPAVASRQLWLRPLAGLLRNRFNNAARIRRLRVPLLMVHGGDDELVPVEQGREIFAAAPGPKQFFVVQGAGHNDTYLADSAEYLQTLRAFADSCVNLTE